MATSKGVPNWTKGGVGRLVCPLSLVCHTSRLRQQPLQEGGKNKRDFGTISMTKCFLALTFMLSTECFGSLLHIASFVLSSSLSWTTSRTKKRLGACTGLDGLRHPPPFPCKIERSGRSISSFPRPESAGLGSKLDELHGIKGQIDRDLGPCGPLLARAFFAAARCCLTAPASILHHDRSKACVHDLDRSNQAMLMPPYEPTYQILTGLLAGIARIDASDRSKQSRPGRPAASSSATAAPSCGEQQHQRRHGHHRRGVRRHWWRPWGCCWACAARGHRGSCSPRRAGRWWRRGAGRSWRSPRRSRSSPSSRRSRWKRARRGEAATGGRAWS